MKAYTDIKQSRKLAEILPIESADMCYRTYREECGIPDYQVTLCPYQLASWVGVPCWSLAALLSVIPLEIFDNEYIINITEGCDDKWVLTYDHCEDMYRSYYGLSSGADNLVDACYKMILKLNEQKLL